jgi:large subunit ribosomal protein L32e
LTKDEFISKVKDLPGVGERTAEKLYEAGYTDLEQLKTASVDELVEKGIGQKTAQAVVTGLQEMEAPAEEQAIEVREEAAPAAEEEVEVVEEEIRPKIKPDLPEDLRKALEDRSVQAARQPSFRRYHWFYKASLTRNPAWRAPRGTLNKQRRGFGYRPPRVKAGYGKPNVTRGLHASGFREILVHNVNDLEKITDPKTEAARIGGTVGGRKRKDIEAQAAEREIRVLNPRRS